MEEEDSELWKKIQSQNKRNKMTRDSTRGGGGGRGRGGARRSTRCPVITGQNHVIPDTNNVINSSNVDICKMCSASVEEDAIGCDRCAAWFHPTTQCTGLRIEAIQLIHSDGGDGVTFVCCSCRCQQPISNASPGQTNETVSQLFMIVQSLAASVQQISNQITNLASNMHQMQTNSSQGSDRSSGTLNRGELYTELFEFEERKRRKDSLIIKDTDVRSENAFRTKFAEISTFVTGAAIVPDEVYCINSDNSLYRVSVLDKIKRLNLLQLNNSGRTRSRPPAPVAQASGSSQGF